jgi:glycosyltransferase involved in cell wall biosynthesis
MREPIGPPALSIVLPCFNEGRRIATSVRELRTWFGPDIEIVVIDDGSTDDTSGQARAVAATDPAIRVHQLPHNRGKGAAVRAAIPVAMGDRVLFVDADMAFDRASVQRVVDALAEFDLAIANRRHRDSRYSVPVSLFGFLYRRHLVGLSFNALLRVLLQLPYRDTQCGLKAFRRDALRQLEPSLTIDGFAFDVEMLLVARALELRIAEVPVMVRYESAKSSVQLARAALAMARSLVTISAARLAGRYSRQRVRTAAAPGEQPQRLR